MKRCLLVLFIVLLPLISCACADFGMPDETSAETTSDIQTSTSAPTPTPIPAPDFSAVDFSGTWYVAELIDSKGDEVSEEKMQKLGTGFTLELITDGTYFVFAETGAILGQGTYSVSLNLLTLTADDEETVYEIYDEDTLRCMAEDSSITVMKHTVEKIEEADSDINDAIDSQD